MIKPRYVEVGNGEWWDYEVRIRFEVNPARMEVLTMSRAEATILRDELNRYLGDNK